MNTHHDLADLLARTRALVAESKQVRMANQDLYRQSYQAAIDARTQLHAYKQLLQDIPIREQYVASSRQS